MPVPARASPPKVPRVWPWILALLGAAVGIGFGHFIGQAFGNGYRLDWYRYRPPSETTAFDASWAAVVASVVVAALLLPLSLAGAYRVWEQWRKEGVLPQPFIHARSRGRHTAFAIFLYGLGVPFLAGLLVLLWLSATGHAVVNPLDFGLVGSVGAGLAGATIGFVAYRRTLSLARSGRLKPADPSENLFAKVALFSGRRSGAMILLILLLTVGLGFGLLRIDTNVDVADVLPRGDPNTDAAHNLTEKFKSSFTLQVTFQIRVAPRDQYDADNSRLPYRQTTPTPENISDEVYVRALDQMIEFVKNYQNDDGERSPFVASVTLADFYRLINWTIAGGTRAPASAFALPGTSPDGERAFDNVHRGVWLAVSSTADAVISPSGRQTAALVTVDPQSDLLGKEIGHWALEIRDAYVAWAESTPGAYKVFTGENAPKFSVDLPIANAHSSDLAAHDFKRLLPIIGVWIFVCIFLAFRSLSAIFIALSALAVGVVWTFGLMGYMGIPLNTLNLTVIPLIMGVGIDYGIHTLNEYKENRSVGRSTEDTFRRLGSHGFFALFVATLNTIVGLAVMIVSPSLLIAQLGVLTCIAIASSFIITITFIPACLSRLTEAKAHDYRPSPLMASIARGVSRHRILTIVFILGMTLGTLWAGQAVGIEPFGDPPRNWLGSDPLRKEHQAAIEGFYDSVDDNVKANILIFEGDITNPAAHRYMDRLEAGLKQYGENKDLPPSAFPRGDSECGFSNSTAEDPRGRSGRVISDTLRTLPFLVRVWLTVKDGVPGAAGYLGLQRIGQPNPAFPDTDPYPATQTEIRSTLDQIATSPLRNFGNLFYDWPADSMAMMVFSVKAASYEDAREVWCQVHDVLLKEEANRPPGIHVSFFGNTAINYLFVAKELPWVGYMSIVDNLLVMAFVYLPTRLLKPTLAVGALNFLTGVWWLGFLPSAGIGLAITLTLPLVFIYAIGSDYGLHLILHAIQEGDTENTFRTTGKGILFSGITTFGAFLIYTQMSNLAVQRTMIATAMAIPIIFVVTMVLVPLLYPVGRKFRREHDRLEAAEGTQLDQASAPRGAAPIEIVERAPPPPSEPAPARKRARRPRRKAVVTGRGT